MYVYPTSTTAVSDSFADHVARGSVNPGTDYVVPAGSNVFAIAAGTVRVADGNPDGSGGRTVCIFHDDGSSSDYLHLNALSVSVGDRVAQGQRIGFSGGSGYGSNAYYGPHLHISFRPHNQIDWFGNVGNVDFDALMRSSQTTAPAGSGTPITNPTPTPKGPLMALSDAEQQEVLDGIRALTGYVYKGGQSVTSGKPGRDFDPQSVVGRLDTLQDYVYRGNGQSVQSGIAGRDFGSKSILGRIAAAFKS